MAFLTKAQTGKFAPAPSIVIYGTPKVGKSTWAANAPSPIFIDLERGSYSLDVARIDKSDINSFKDVMAILRELYSEEHDYKTVVIDSIDWLERMIFDDIAKEHNARSIDDSRVANLGFGKGYTLANAEMGKLTKALDALRIDKGITVILICHAIVETLTLPGVDAYNHYQLKLHKKNIGLFQEWAQCILFAKQKMVVTQTDSGFNKKLGKGHAGEHMIYTKESGAYLAGNRFGLPEELPLSWNAFITEYNKFFGSAATKKVASTESSPSILDSTIAQMNGASFNNDNDFLDI